MEFTGNRQGAQLRSAQSRAPRVGFENSAFAARARATTEHAMKVQEVPIEKIKYGLRYRTADGDIGGLANSIREVGLLQPVGVDQNMQLIYGGRRVRACSIELGWKTIPAVVLSLKSVLRGQHDENEFRKQFTPSERAAIAQAIEEELGSRKGQRTDLAANAAKSDKGKTVDLAAKRAGFSSAETYERAKTVTEKGSPELVEAMDKGTVSISAAAAIASQPKQEQTRIIGLDKEEREAVVRRIRSTRADKEADERSAQDCYVFGGFYEALKLIGGFHVTAGEIWKGLARVHAYDASDHLARAIARLLELDKEHPNNPRRAELTVMKK